MAATATERKLFVGGEWIETGDWLDVRSPYSGDVVGRVAKAGADETRRAIDAAEGAMREPLPAHKRAEILVRVAGALGRRHEEAARLISDEAGKPLKAARVEAARALSTYTFAAVEARKLAGEMVPMDAAAAADVSTAAAKVAQNAFSFAGQSCISVQRVYVERSVYDEFVRQLVPLVEALKVGDPGDEDTDVGPVIDEHARARILEWIKASSGQVLTGGELDGELIRPTGIANPAPDDEVSCEEVFGPGCTVTAVDSMDEAIALANGTRYGLQAGIFTASLDNGLRAAQELEFGGVTVNEAPTFRSDQMPYGGVKDSGNTREGPRYAVREMTEDRLVVVDLP